MPYPVDVTVEPLITNRNRLTTAFRLILAIPHAILVGDIGFSIAGGDEGGVRPVGSETGLLGAVAWVLAIVSWFTILFARTHIVGIRQFTAFYLRWRTRAMAYMALFTDQYPPFGDGPYPASIEVVPPLEPRRDVALRLLFAIPHVVVLFFLILAWFVTTVIAWFAILFTRRYPASMHAFGVGVMRWALRVEAYVLLLVDEYPPFKLE